MFTLEFSEFSMFGCMLFRIATPTFELFRPWKACGSLPTPTAEILFYVRVVALLLFTVALLDDIAEG